jgi:hypothetical protein
LRRAGCPKVPIAFFGARLFFDLVASCLLLLLFLGEQLEELLTLSVVIRRLKQFPIVLDVFPPDKAIHRSS